MNIWSIAVNTYRESIRDRTLAAVAVFVAIVLACALLAGYMAVGQERKILLDVGLSSFSFFGSIVAIFLGVGAVRKEIDRRTLNFLLSKPVPRYQLILGKFLGLALTLLVLSFLMTLSLTVTEILLVRGVSLNSISFWPAAGLLYFELLIVTGLAMFFAVFSTPALSTVLTVTLFLIGRMSMELKWWGEAASFPIIRWLSRFFYILLPNLATFNFIAEVAHGQTISLNLFWGGVQYAIFYLIFLLLGAIYIFERRNLT